MCTFLEHKNLIGRILVIHKNGMHDWIYLIQRREYRGKSLIAPSEINQNKIKQPEPVPTTSGTNDSGSHILTLTTFNVDFTLNQIVLVIQNYLTTFVFYLCHHSRIFPAMFVLHPCHHLLQPWKCCHPSKRCKKKKEKTSVWSKSPLKFTKDNINLKQNLK